MGIQAGHCQAGGSAANGGHGFVGKDDDLQHAIRFEEVGDIGKCDVSCDQRAGDFLRGKHHGMPWRVRLFDEVFGVSGVGEAGEMPCFLVNGIGHNTGVIPCQGSLDGKLQTLEGMSAGRR